MTTASLENANSEQNEAVLERQREKEHLQTVRGVCETEATKYTSKTLGADDKEKLVSATMEEGRKWGVQAHGSRPDDEQAWMESGLDLRLDCLHQRYRADLVDTITQYAVSKLKELEKDQANAQAAPTLAPNKGSAIQDNGAPKGLSEQL